MEADLLALLESHAPLTALVGQNIAWNHIPQATGNPVVSLWIINKAPGYHMQGEDGLDSTVVQIDVRATKVTDMWAIAKVIRSLLSGFKGSQGTTDFQGIFLTSERQRSEKPNDLLFHMAQIDFTVHSRAAA